MKKIDLDDLVDLKLSFNEWVERQNLRKDIFSINEMFERLSYSNSLTYHYAFGTEAPIIPVIKFYSKSEFYAEYKESLKCYISTKKKLKNIYGNK